MAAPIDHTFTIKQNDTRPVLTEQLFNALGPFDVTGATVRMHLKRPDNTVADLPMTIITSTAGIVRWTPAPGDTAQVGTYLREIQVTLSDGGIETFPNDTVGYPVNVTDDIA